MNQHLRDIQTKITPKLVEIARPRRSRDAHGLQHPGFKILLGHWKGISNSLFMTMFDLSRRLNTATSAPTEPDEVILTRKEFDTLVSHMKNSWEETIDDDGYVYVNVHNSNLTRLEMPENAFIKRYRVSRPVPAPAPRPSNLRTSSYERRSDR